MKQGEIWREPASLTQGMKHLEFLAEIAGMQQLQERLFAGAEAGGFGGDGGTDELAGVVHEERFLRLFGWRAETVASERVRQPVPANMTGEILSARTREQVVRLRVAVIGAGGAGRGGFGEFTPGFAVVEGHEQAGPRLRGDCVGEGCGGEREIETVTGARSGG